MTKEELLEIKGGISWQTIATLGAGIVSFVIGFLEGLISPKKC